MLKTTLKRTSIALASTLALSLGSISLSTSAQSAPLHLNPIQSAQSESLIQSVGFRSHRNISRSRHHSRSHSRGFKRHSFKRGQHFRSNKFSQHGGYTRHQGHQNQIFRKNRFPGFVLSPKSR